MKTKTAMRTATTPLVIFEGDDEREQSGDARARHEAGSDWLVQQGFDAKD
jgi:hypothetical protein